MKTNKNVEMPNAHLHELFVDELRDILGAEKALLKGLKKMSSAAQSEQLKAAFDAHYQETEGQISRLKEAFTSLGMSARAKKCKAMEGLLAEAEEIIEEFEDQAEVIDAALITAAQKVEHYEIASYGSLATFAKLMEHNEVLDLLKANLAEEKDTDLKLTDIAMSANTGAGA